MKQSYREFLGESLMEVLEQVAFLFPVPAETDKWNDLSINNGSTLCFGITFEGPVTGRIFLLISEMLTKEIAANMLGIDEEDPDVQQKSIDATKEILNILCGNLLPKIYGKEPVFHLCTPYIIDEFENEEIEIDSIDKISLDVDGNLISAFLKTEL